MLRDFISLNEMNPCKDRFEMILVNVAPYGRH